jgi:hypothetical protein
MDQPAYRAILRSNERTAAWLEYLEGISPPAGPVSVPEGEAFIAALRDLDVPEDDIGTLVRLRPDVVHNADLSWLLDRSA